MSKYTHQVNKIGGRLRGLCGVHTSEAHARKAVARLVTMSRGKLTEKDFEVVPRCRPDIAALEAARSR